MCRTVYYKTTDFVRKGIASSNNRFQSMILFDIYFYFHFVQFCV